MTILNMILPNIEGGGGGWQPGANTLLYMPMNSTYQESDQSGNNVSTTNNGVTFGTYQGVDCGEFNDSNIQINSFDIPAECTVLCRCYNTGMNKMDGKIFDARDGNNSFVTGFTEIEGYFIQGVDSVIADSNNHIQNQRILFVGVVEFGTGKVYLLGQGVNTYADGPTVTTTTFTPTYMNVGDEWNNGAPRYFIGGMSNLIIENKARTAQEIQDYYNQTKANYGIQSLSNTLTITPNITPNITPTITPNTPNNGSGSVLTI